jgi:hypothetical protein
VGLDARRFTALAILVLAAPWIVRFYARNERLGTVPETIAAGVTAFAIVDGGTLDLTNYFPRPADRPDAHYAVRFAPAGAYGIEPVASPLTFAPFFLPYRGTGAIHMQWRLFHRVAARVTTLTVLLLALWLLGITTLPRALLVTAVLALATSLRTINAGGLWQHTSADLWAVVGLALWTATDRRPGLYPLAGIALALATACRPIFVPCALLVVWAALRDGRRAGAGAATAGLVVAIGGLALFGNWWLHGSLLGGRASIVAQISRTHGVPSYFHFTPWTWVGLLAAPSRGLFVYSPVLLFGLPGLVRSLRASASPAERLITVAGLLVFVLYGFVATWWGGWLFGPRHMTDMLPFFALWLARTPLPARGRVPLGVLFAAAFCWSFAVFEVGVRAYPCGWDAHPVNVDQAPDRLWSLHDTELSRCWMMLSGRPGALLP